MEENITLYCSSENDKRWSNYLVFSYKKSPDSIRTFFIRFHPFRNHRHQNLHHPL